MKQPRHDHDDIDDSDDEDNDANGDHDDASLISARSLLFRLPLRDFLRLWTPRGHAQARHRCP